MIDLKNLAAGLEYCLSPMAKCAKCPYGEKLAERPDMMETCPAMTEAITALMMYAAGLSREEAQGTLGQETLAAVREAVGDGWKGVEPHGVE